MWERRKGGRREGREAGGKEGRQGERKKRRGKGGKKEGRREGKVGGREGGGKGRRKEGRREEGGMLDGRKMGRLLRRALPGCILSPRHMTDHCLQVAVDAPCSQVRRPPNSVLDVSGHCPSLPRPPHPYRESEPRLLRLREFLTCVLLCFVQVLAPPVAVV